MIAALGGARNPHVRCTLRLLRSVRLVLKPLTTICIGSAGSGFLRPAYALLGILDFDSGIKEPVADFVTQGEILVFSGFSPEVKQNIDNGIKSFAIQFVTTVIGLAVVLSIFQESPFRLCQEKPAALALMFLTCLRDDQEPR